MSKQQQTKIEIWKKKLDFTDLQKKLIVEYVFTMNNKPPGKISLNLGGLKLGSSSKAFEDDAEPSTSKKSMGMGFKTFGKTN